MDKNKNNHSRYRYLVALMVVLLFTGCTKQTDDRSSRRKNRDNEMSDEVKDVSDFVEGTISSSKFSEADVDEKAEMLEEVFEEMYDEGIVEDYFWDEEHKVYGFTFSDGSLGGLSLQEFDDSLDVAGGSIAAADEVCSSAVLEERSISAIVLNGFENTPFRRDYYENLSREWKQAGIDCNVDTLVTLEDLTDLKGYDLVVFSMHGAMVDLDVAIVPNEPVTKSTDRKFRSELDKKHVARVGTASGEWHYWVFSDFFTDNYNEGDLDGTFIYAQPCKFYGCDCTGLISYDYATTFVDELGATAVVGYHNSVGSEYGRNVMNSTCMSMFGGSTVSEALEQAVYKYGSDDGWKDVLTDKYKAYPIIYGDADAKIVKEKRFDSDPIEFFDRLNGCWFDVKQNEFVCFIPGEDQQNSGPYNMDYYSGKMASDVAEYGYVKECIFDKDNRRARVVAYFEGYLNGDMEYVNDPFELVRIFDYSMVESDGILRCYFEDNDLVPDLKYFGPFSEETMKEMNKALHEQ